MIDQNKFLLRSVEFIVAAYGIISAALLCYYSFYTISFSYYFSSRSALFWIILGLFILVSCLGIYAFKRSKRILLLQFALMLLFSVPYFDFVNGYWATGNEAEKRFGIVIEKEHTTVTRWGAGLYLVVIKSALDRKTKLSVEKSIYERIREGDYLEARYPIGFLGAPFRQAEFDELNIKEKAN